MADNNQRYQVMLPLGTQVVTIADVRDGHGRILHTRGAVGVIVKQPVFYTHSYRIELVNGAAISLKRAEIAPRKEHQAADFGNLGEEDLFNRVIYRCLVGSRAYGLDREGSDRDLRGIYLPPADRHWSLVTLPEQIEKPDTDECYWELQKFLTLALKANPNILECLYTPLVDHATPLAQDLLAMRSSFLSRLVYQTYNGYVLSQFKKLQADLRNHGGIRWKHAMHLIRLLISGIKVLQEGVLQVKVEQHRERLLAIRDGEMTWEEIDRWRLDLHRDFDAAHTRTCLPERPDFARAEDFLIRARREMVDHEN